MTRVSEPARKVGPGKERKVDPFVSRTRTEDKGSHSDDRKDPGSGVPCESIHLLSGASLKNVCIDERDGLIAVVFPEPS